MCFDVTDNDSDTDSVAELEYKTWDDACAWEFRNAPGNIFDELIRNTSYYTDDDESPEGFGQGGYVDAGIYPPRLCIVQRHNRLDNGIRNDDSRSIHRLYHKRTNYWHVDDMDYPSPAVCYDWRRVMSLIWPMMFLSHDGDGTVNGTGHDGVYDCSPAGILGCLPRCLCLPWAIDGMTQHLTKINRPGSDMKLGKTMYSGVRRGVCTSDTPPEDCSVAGCSLALIDRRASVGGSVGPADWPHVLGAVDKPPGRVWIGFIRQALEDSKSIVFVPVIGPLISPTVFSCRDADFTDRSSRYWIICDKDWVLPAGYQVLLQNYAKYWTKDADGFSIVDNRAGVTFGVELYVPWDAPEMAVDLDSAGTVPLRNVLDVFGMIGKSYSTRKRRA